MAVDLPIVDVWTQYLTGTPPGVNPEGENVFRNYGMLDVFHHGTDPAKMIDAMDRRGVRVALMAGENGMVAQVQNRYPGRIYGQYHADHRHIMQTFGKDKVCFATDYPLLQWERVLPEVDALELAPEIKQRFLHDNAVKAFKLPA